MPKRTDANQASIVADLRKLGASVLDLHTVGRGCPDILVGWHGIGLLVEIKSSEKAKLTKAEKEFHQEYPGLILVAWTTEQIVEWFSGNRDKLEGGGHKDVIKLCEVCNKKRPRSGYRVCNDCLKSGKYKKMDAYK